MALKRFIQIGKTGIYERGDDTCGHPYITIHAPAERVASADKWLVRICDPRDRQFAGRKQRSLVYAAKTRPRALRIANVAF